MAVESASATREAIVAALVTHNPRLERFQFDYREIASLRRISESEARARYSHSELTPPEGDLAIQLTDHNDQMASGTNGIVEAVAVEPVRKVRLLLGEHDKPLSELT
ncbi:MAG: hypothetical protein ABSG51_04560 [Terracidiphilus sp.]